MPDTVINKLEDCKAIIRIGTGFDSVDHLTAATRDIQFVMCQITELKKLPITQSLWP